MSGGPRRDVGRRGEGGLGRGRSVNDNGEGLGRGGMTAAAPEPLMLRFLYSHSCERKEWTDLHELIQTFCKAENSINVS